MKTFYLVCMFLLATSGLAAQQMTSGTLQVGGVDRTYLVHVPPGDSSAKALPLLLALHGSGMTSELMAEVTGLNAWADKTGFIVVYPQGLEKHWSTGLPPGAGGYDFAFVKDLLAKMESSYSVDRSRVIVAGYSNGAEFGQELACSADLRFKAIVAIDGTLTIESAGRCAPKHPVRLIEFHGTADPLVPYLGGRVAVPNGGRRPSAMAADQSLRARPNDREAIGPRRRRNTRRAHPVPRLCCRRGGDALPHPRSRSCVARISQHAQETRTDDTADRCEPIHSPARLWRD